MAYVDGVVLNFVINMIDDDSFRPEAYVTVRPHPFLCLHSQILSILLRMNPNMSNYHQYMILLLPVILACA